MEKLSVKFKPQETKDGYVVALRGTEPVRGEKVSLVYKTTLGEFYVKDYYTKDLNALNATDLAPFGVDHSRFWSRMESAYKTGLPGNSSITIMTLSRDKPRKKKIVLTPTDIVVEQSGDTL
jgi:hypothetical protein